MTARSKAAAMLTELSARLASLAETTQPPQGYKDEEGSIRSAHRSAELSQVAQTTKALAERAEEHTSAHADHDRERPTTEELAAARADVERARQALADGTGTETELESAVHRLSELKVRAAKADETFETRTKHNTSAVDDDLDPIDRLALALAAEQPQEEQATTPAQYQATPSPVQPPPAPPPPAPPPGELGFAPEEAPSEDTTDPLHELSGPSSSSKPPPWDFPGTTTSADTNPVGGSQPATLSGANTSNDISGVPPDRPTARSGFPGNQQPMPPAGPMPPLAPGGSTKANEKDKPKTIDKDPYRYGGDIITDHDVRR